MGRTTFKSLIFGSVMIFDSEDVEAILSAISKLSDFTRKDAMSLIDTSYLPHTNLEDNFELSFEISNETASGNYVVCRLVMKNSEKIAIIVCRRKDIQTFESGTIHSREHAQLKMPSSRAIKILSMFMDECDWPAPTFHSISSLNVPFEVSKN